MNALVSSLDDGLPNQIWRTESSATVELLVDRLQRELSRESSFSSEMKSCPKDLLTTVERNIHFLQRIWFEIRVRQFHEAPDESKHEFLDQQIRFVENWPVFGDMQLEAVHRQFFSDIERWILESPSNEQPAMNDAVAHAVVRWLETRDLSEQPVATRELLAERIAAYLNEGDVKMELAETESNLFRQNASSLMRSWFLACARQFHQLPNENRMDYVKEKLAEIRQWDLSWFTNEESTNTTRILFQIAKKIDAWIGDSSEVEQPKLRGVPTRRTACRMEASFLETELRTSRDCSGFAPRTLFCSLCSS